MPQPLQKWKEELLHLPHHPCRLRHLQEEKKKAKVLQFEYLMIIQLEPSVRPAIKMKQLFWRKLQNRELGGSVWNLVDSEKPKINVTELEQLFGNEISEKKEDQVLISS